MVLLDIFLSIHYYEKDGGLSRNRTVLWSKVRLIKKIHTKPISVTPPHRVADWMCDVLCVMLIDAYQNGMEGERNEDQIMLTSLRSLLESQSNISRGHKQNCNMTHPLLTLPHFCTACTPWPLCVYRRSRCGCTWTRPMPAPPLSAQNLESGWKVKITEKIIYWMSIKKV